MSKIEFYSNYDDVVNKNKEIIIDLEKKLNERGFLFASEWGLPMSDKFGIVGFSEGVWDPDWRCEVGEVLDDGTVFIDWNPVSDNMMKLYILESKLDRKFMNLEERIENCWV